jgi:sugar phosphate permease
MSSTGHVEEIGGRRAWTIWAVAMAVYLLAVFHRSSLGVAGLLAADRFDISATQLAMFTVLQLLVYAGLQIPVGVLLDRYGAKALLLVGLLLMTVGQLAFAFVTSFPVAVLARAVVGAGDAMIFVSVVRLVTLWFLVRQVPVVMQLTGPGGQFGAIIAAAPLSLALREFGWTAAFALSAALGVLLAVAVVLGVSSTPYPRRGADRVKLRALIRQLRWVWGNPGTRLGMWSHFTGQFPGTVFGLLWGFPFLVRGQGLSPDAAASLLMLMIASGLVSGFVLGWLVGKYPFHRSHLVVGVALAIAFVWAVVLLWPGRSPLWLLVVLVLVLGAGGPASMVGFDLSRSFIPSEASGRANGVVNIGGFVSSLVTLFLVGLVLDLLSGGSAGYDLEDFKWALSVQFLVLGVGVVQILRYRRKAIAHLRREHPGAVESMQRGEPFVHPGFADREGV